MADGTVEDEMSATWSKSRGVLVMRFNKKIEVKDDLLMQIICARQDIAVRHGRMDIQEQSITSVFSEEWTETINDGTPEMIAIDIQGGVIGGTSRETIEIPPTNWPKMPITIIP